MNVAGVIHTAGSRPLKDFAYGEIAVNIINSLITVDPPITLDTTGKAIIRLLDSMPDSEKNLIMSFPISLVDANGDFVAPVKKTNINPKMAILISFSLGLVIISGVTTYFHVTTLNDPTKPVDASTMSTVITVIGEIIKALLQ